MLAAASLLFLLATAPGLPPAENRHTVAYNIEQEAETAEAHGDPVKAIELYKEAIKEDASESPMTTTARARIDWLQKRSDNNFASLIALQRLQQRRFQDIRPQDMVEFEKQVDAMPSGILRRECRGFIADVWLRILRDPQKGLQAHQKWLAEPDLEDAQKRVAKQGLAVAQSRIDRATQHPVAPVATEPSHGSDHPGTGTFALRFLAILAGVVLAIVIGVRWRR